MSEHSQGFFEGASPKLLFFFGLTIGIAVIAVLAFAVTLGMSVSDTGVSARGSNANVAGATDTNPTPTPKATQADLKKLVDSVHLRGDKDADITIVEFSDYQCPFCSKVHPTMQSLLSSNDGKINWGYRHLPLTIHPQAQPSAEAAECADEQGKFWEFTDALFTNQERLGSSLFTEVATNIGLDGNAFQACVSGGKYKDKVASDLALASSFGATGTPHFVMINNKTGEWDSISGALPQATFQQAIDTILGS